MWKRILFMAYISNFVVTEPIRPLGENPNFEEKQKIDQQIRTLSYIMLPGVKPEPLNNKTIPRVEYDEEFINNLPESFDARKQWPYCPSLKEIRDQGGCGSCWAVSTVAAMTDRVCIYSKGREQFHFSAEDLTTCSQGGCDGGSPYTAWLYWTQHGLVSGGNYGSHEGCRPYSIPPLSHHIAFLCIGSYTPECKRSCVDGYSVPYEKDLRFGKRAYQVEGEKNMMAELYKNGPLVATFKVYEDFKNYTNGVYRHISGKFLANHAVKLIGWGVEKGVNYWLMANSWGTKVGEEGYFKILRGVNECGIEDHGSAGEPLLKDYSYL